MANNSCVCLLTLFDRNLLWRRGTAGRTHPQTHPLLIIPVCRKPFPCGVGGTRVIWMFIIAEPKSSNELASEIFSS